MVLFPGFCTTNDVDIFLRHMNNARYIRELDFARFHFYDRTGIYENIMAAKGHALQGASSIRYRRTIPIFTAYKVETRVCTSVLFMFLLILLLEPFPHFWESWPLLWWTRLLEVLRCMESWELQGQTSESSFSILNEAHMTMTCLIREDAIWIHATVLPHE